VTRWSADSRVRRIPTPNSTARAAHCSCPKTLTGVEVAESWRARRCRVKQIAASDATPAQPRREPREAGPGWVRPGAVARPGEGPVREEEESPKEAQGAAEEVVNHGRGNAGVGQPQECRMEVHGGDDFCRGELVGGW